MQTKRDDRQRFIEERLFELPGACPAWMWAHPCDEPKCPCRRIFVLASDQSPSILLKRLCEFLEQSLPHGYEHAKHLLDKPDIVHFSLDIDSGAIYAHASSENPLDPAEHPRSALIANRIDGELLDSIDDLWHRGKGKPTPEQRLLSVKTIAVDGWEPGRPVAWNKLCPEARRDIYLLGQDKYHAVEMYWPDLKGPCGDASVHFKSAVRDGPEGPGSVRVNDHGITIFEPEGNRPAVLDELWTAFKTRHPKYVERFSERSALVKRIGGRLATHITVPTRTAKLVRNAPCPCGSGRKYKKCCESDASLN
jgi:hypothetical protein